MLLNLVSSWWQAVTRPAADTFRQLAEDQSHGKALAGVLIAAVLGLGLSWVIHRLLHDPGEEFMGLASIWLPKSTAAPIANWGVLVPLGIVYGFYTFEIVLFVFAWLLGGKGSFKTQSYTQSLFYGPLAVMQQVTAVIPNFGGLLFALVAAGSLIPTTTSLKAVHGYSTGRALLTWIFPIILNVLITIGIVALAWQARR